MPDARSRRSRGYDQRGSRPVCCGALGPAAKANRRARAGSNPPARRAAPADTRAPNGSANVRGPDPPSPGTIRIGVAWSDSAHHRRLARCGRDAAGFRPRALRPRPSRARAAAAGRPQVERDPPSSISSTRSASATASATSWVTSTAVKPCSRQMRSSRLLHLDAGQRVERAERLVEQQHARAG